MDYIEFEELCRGCRGKVCIYGAGLIGKTWAYDLLSAAGIKPDYYCDKNYNVCKCVNDIPIISPEELHNTLNEVSVFLALSEEYHDEVCGYLEKKNIKIVAKMGNTFFQQIMNSIYESKNENVIKRYLLVTDDRKYLERRYEAILGSKLNVDNPRNFNEKIQWLKIHDKNPKYPLLVDKYEVKKIVAKEIGEDYLIPTLGLFDNFDEIDFDSLPNSFVLKCTHDSGSVVICKNKSLFDVDNARKKLERCLATNYYLWWREWPYKNVKPRIIAEKYIVDTSSCENELMDYKVFNFNGEPYIIQVDYDRFVDHKRNLYYTDWKYIEAEIEFKSNKEKIIKKPIVIDEMLEVARKLSQNIPHARTDFYCIGDKLYFGEITLYHGGGFEKIIPEKFNSELGDKLILPRL